MLSITFTVLPRGSWMDEDEVAISIWPSDFEDDGMYDDAFDDEIYNALGDFGISEVQEGAFEYDETNGPFDSKKFIEFMASRGIKAIEEECEEE